MTYTVIKHNCYRICKHHELSRFGFELAIWIRSSIMISSTTIIHLHLPEYLMNSAYNRIGVFCCCLCDNLRISVSICRQRDDAVPDHQNQGLRLCQPDESDNPCSLSKRHLFVAVKRFLGPWATPILVNFMHMNWYIFMRFYIST